MAYESLAASYDRLTNDIPYEEILHFYDQILARYDAHPETALDLACGTGSMAVLLAGRGLSVLGVDQSEEMLVEAYAKTMGSDNPPYFIHQRMERLRLPAPVDLVVCCLDGLNYLTDPEQVCETFRRVHKALTPNGLSTSIRLKSSDRLTVKSSWTRTTRFSASGAHPSTSRPSPLRMGWTYFSVSSLQRQGKSAPTAGHAPARSTWSALIRRPTYASG